MMFREIFLSPLFAQNTHPLYHASHTTPLTDLFYSCAPTYSRHALYAGNQNHIWNAGSLCSFTCLLRLGFFGALDDSLLPASFQTDVDSPSVDACVKLMLRRQLRQMVKIASLPVSCTGHPIYDSGSSVDKPALFRVRPFIIRRSEHAGVSIQPEYFVKHQSLESPTLT